MTRWERAVTDHHASIAEFSERVRSIPLDRWLVPRREGKWSPAEVALHVRRVYDVQIATLGGQGGLRSRVPEWQATLLRHTILPLCIAAGRLPSGFRAPREVVPDLAASADGTAPADLAAQIVERARTFEDAVAAAAARGHDVELRHPYFGMLGGAQGLRFLALHTRHHLPHLGI